MKADDVRLKQGREFRGLVALMRVRLLLPVIALALVTSGCNIDALTASFRDRREVFASLRVGVDGASRKEVVTKMGVPLESQLSNIAGMQIETLAFSDAHSKYSVTLLSGTTWRKTATPKSTNPKKGDLNVTNSK